MKNNKLLVLAAFVAVIATMFVFWNNSPIQADSLDMVIVGSSRACSPEVAPGFMPRPISGRMFLTILVVRTDTTKAAHVIHNTLPVIAEIVEPNTDPVVIPDPICDDCGHQQWEGEGPHPSPYEGCGYKYGEDNGNADPMPMPEPSYGANGNKP